MLLLLAALLLMLLLLLLLLLLLRYFTLGESRIKSRINKTKTTVPRRHRRT